MELFTGVCTALITPFFNGEVDYKSLTRMVKASLESGVSALSVVGTTGEAPTLTSREKRRITDIAKGLTQGAIPIVRGIGSPDTAICAKEAVDAKRDGADVLLTLTPYYNRCTQKGLIAHFGAIAKATSLPIIIYNVPSRTGVDILPETIYEIARLYDNVVGIKEASGNIGRISLLTTIPELNVYSGDDALTLPALSVGAKGVISVVSNVAPRAMCKLCDSFFKGDNNTAYALHQKLLPIMKVMFEEVNPIPIKYACAYIGAISSPEVRLPLTECSIKQKLVFEMQKFGYTENGGYL